MLKIATYDTAMQAPAERQEAMVMGGEILTAAAVRRATGYTQGTRP
jgi:hypothetical protein